MCPTGDEADARRSTRGRYAQGEQGFTLIEVLISLVIIAVAMIGLLGLQARNITAVGRDQQLTLATLLARQRISDIQTKVLLDGNLESVHQARGDFKDMCRGGRGPCPYLDFAWNLDVSDGSDPDMRVLTLQVTWDKRMPRACEIVYIIRDPAL